VEKGCGNGTMAIHRVGPGFLFGDPKNDAWGNGGNRGWRNRALPGVKEDPVIIASIFKIPKINIGFSVKFL